jgi:hypothetical protein
MCHALGRIDHLFHQLGCGVVVNTFVVDEHGRNGGMMRKPVHDLCDKTPKEASLEMAARLNHALLEANDSVNSRAITSASRRRSRWSPRFLTLPFLR